MIPLSELEDALRFERVTSWRQTDRGLLAESHTEHLRIDIVRPDVVRVKISRGQTFDETPTYAVCVDPLSQPVEFTVEVEDDRVYLHTSAVRVTLGLDPFRLDVHRADGSAVVETAADDDGHLWAYATLNDVFALRRRCRQEDAMFGLGEKTGGHNRRGRSFTLWNTDVLSPYGSRPFTADKAPDDPRSDRTSTEFDPYYVSIPFFYHQTYPDGRMSASFIDNSYPAEYNFSRTDEYRIAFAGGQYTEYIFAGPGMPEILEAYTWLTGRTAPPPLWALGYHQCRWFRYTQEAVENIAARHRARGIPCDAIWLDIEYMDEYRVFTWNREAFPDVPGMLARLDAQGFRLITIVDPGVKFEPGYRVFDEGLARDAFCRTEGGDIYIGQVWPGTTAFPDFVSEETRTWWGELNAEHVRSGIAGIWNDMNEPATGRIRPDGMRFDHGQYSHQRYHNQYALLMAMGTTAGLLHAFPERRTFVLSRAGFAGIQRYAANWMGDNYSRWDHLWLSVPMAMGMGISGQAFIGADIGGFAGNCTPELFLRWVQYGTLTPFCRNHSELGNVDQYAWSFGEPIEHLVRAAIQLRYRLLPYIYTAFLRASETGAPVQRPLVFDYQHDGTVRDIDDEYLFGPDLLIAPVFRPGQTARQVYLPAGVWYDWYTGACLDGARFVVADTPMDRIPIYAHGGSVIPLWPEAPASTADYAPPVIDLHVFVPSADGSWESLLQEDDGLTFGLLDGARHRTTFHLERHGSRVTLRADVDGQGFTGFVRRGFRMVVHGASPATVELDGADLPPTNEGTFALPVAARPFTIAFDVSGNL